MRPYQVYATEALIRQALNTNSNGYIWHTTGSGKTLTSWKCANLLKNEPSIAKVFFLSTKSICIKVCFKHLIIIFNNSF